MNNNPSTTPAQCPFRGTRIGGAIGSKPQTDDWWPNRLQVELLHQNLPQANPLRDFDYKAAFPWMCRFQCNATACIKFTCRPLLIKGNLVQELRHILDDDAALVSMYHLGNDRGKPVSRRWNSVTQAIYPHLSRESPMNDIKCNSKDDEVYRCCYSGIFVRHGLLDCNGS